MRRLVYRVLLWLHDDVSFCGRCKRGHVCEQALYLRRRAGLPALTRVR